MLGRTKKTAGWLGLSTLVTIGGCPTGQVIGTILALQTFVFVLNQTGVLDVRAGSTEPTRSAGVFSLNLDGGAADEPDSAQLQLGTVRALPLDGSSKSLEQSLTGSATITVFCASASTANPCTGGVLVGDYQLSISGGNVTATVDSLPVPSAALPFVISGEFAVCFEVTATIDVRIVIEDMQVTFGEDAGPNPAPVDEDPQPNDASSDDSSNDSDDTSTDTTPPTFSTCPDEQDAEADSDGNYVLPTYSGNASDDSGSVTVTQSPTAGTQVGVGATTVTLTARDAAGNEARCSFQVQVAASTPGSGGGYIPALIRHSGSEQIVAGSEIDGNFGLVTRDDFTTSAQVFDSFNKSYAVNGFGTRIWFRQLAPFSVEGLDRTQVWCINTDGSGAQRSTLPADLKSTFGCHLETNEDGNVCVINMGGKILRANPGDPLEELYDFAGEFDFRAAYKVNDNGDRCWLVDLGATTVNSIDLNAIPYTPTVIIDRDSQALMGSRPRALASQEFDLAGDFPAYVFLRNYNFGSSVEPGFQFQDQFWFGSGIISPKIDPIVRDVVGTRSPYDLNITDDGLTFAYCQNISGSTDLDPPVPCFVETVEGDRTEVGDGRTRPGGLTLSDNGARVFYVDSAIFGGSNGIIEDVGTGRKVAAGTIAFAPNWDREFVRVDDIGRTFVTNCDAGGAQGGLYVLHDGNSILSGFPKIDGISYRFEDECTLRVRAVINGPRGISRVLMMPLNDGVNPTKWVPGEDNVFFAIRDPNVNRMRLVEGTTNVYELVFNLTNSQGDCVREKLTDAFTLRIVAVDTNETLSVFEEFSPAQ